MASPNQLSFLPDDYLERKAQRRTNAVCAVLFVVVMSGVGTAFWLSEQASKRISDKHTRAETEYVAEARNIERNREIREKQKRMAHQAELSGSLLERVPRSNVLAEITNNLPVGVSLLEFTLDSKAHVDAAAKSAAPKTAYEQKKLARSGKPETAEPAAPQPKVYDVTLKVTGVAHNEGQVAQFLSKMSNSKLFSDANLVISEPYKINDKSAEKNNSLRKFQIEMSLSRSAEAAIENQQQDQTTSIELKE